MSLFGLDASGITLDAVARIIQMALTPVFLLTGLATLLNVFSTRLARVSTRVDQAVNALGTADPEALPVLRDQLLHLRRRSLALDTAVVLGAAAGAGTCMTVLLLFLGLSAAARSTGSCCGVRDRDHLRAGRHHGFATEMLMAGTGIRAELVHDARRRFLRLHNDT